MTHTFPFGQPLKRVQQQDKSPKKVFVLGVYASAVHAKWIRDGKQVVAALAVASEPYIFWRGEDAAKIISGISIPPELGQLLPANKNLNGPSGKILDEKYLEPLGLDRSNTWLCDIIPESRLNPRQQKAVKDHYLPIAAKNNLPLPTIPLFDPTELASPHRREEILEELEISQAELLILFGDQPIKWFLQPTSTCKYTSLAQFGEPYGRIHETMIAGKPYKVLPLCHPRQAGRLGRSSTDWYLRHKSWMNSHTS